MSDGTSSNSNPVRQLIDEHRMFMKALEELATAIRSIPPGQLVLPGDVLSTAERVWREVNQHLNVHFVKEEEIFFPCIERLLPGARVKFQFLHVDHDRLRDLFEDFTHTLQDYRAQRGESGIVERLKRVSEEMIWWFSSHIVAEDTIYFELAAQQMTDDEANDVLARMSDLESKLRERYTDIPEPVAVRSRT